ncbi:FAD-dependent oxidoreductase, partial [Rhizobium johnstonii]
AAHFGADIRKELSVATMSSWAAAPHIGGSYSYAEPGSSDQRGRLAAPHDERIFFAGDAGLIGAMRRRITRLRTGFAG